VPSRRDALRLGGCTLVSLLSGCQSVLPGGRSRIDLKLYNYTDDGQTLIFELLRAGDHSYEDALVAEREFDVPPPSGDESAGVIYEEAFAKSRVTSFGCCCRTAMVNGFIITSIRVSP
jgi:hypothetical protein